MHELAWRWLCSSSDAPPLPPLPPECHWCGTDAAGAVWHYDGKHYCHECTERWEEDQRSPRTDEPRVRSPSYSPSYSPGPITEDESSEEERSEEEEEPTLP